MRDLGEPQPLAGATAAKAPMEAVVGLRGPRQKMAPWGTRCSKPSVLVSSQLPVLVSSFEEPASADQQQLSAESKGLSCDGAVPAAYWALRRSKNLSVWI